MKAYDFEFAGRKLSSFGMVICNFGDKGLDTISNGSQILFLVWVVINIILQALPMTIASNQLSKYAKILVITMLWK